MSSNKVWNLVYVVGNTERVVSAADNPQTRANALSGAETVAKNGWRVWVQHHQTGKRIFESPAEIEAKKAAYERQLEEFVTRNLPPHMR